MVRSFNLFGKRYHIRYVDQKKIPKYIVPDGTEVCGAIDMTTQTIFIDKNLNDQMVIHTILHEIIHAITKELLIESCIKSSDVEKFIDNLAVGLYDILVSNKWVDKKKFERK